jgi:branched-chain amino acid aminotransferase
VSPVWADGALVPADQPLVPATDRGLLVGEGVFDTLRAVDGVPFALGRHLARLRASAEVLGIDVPWSDEELRAAVLAVVADRPGRARVRITVTGGDGSGGGGGGGGGGSSSSGHGGRPRTLVTAVALDRPAPSATLRTSPWPVNERAPSVGAKTTSRVDLVLALADAKGHGADEAILVNTAGHLVECTGANLFVVDRGRLVTPALRSGCLPGTTRQLVLEVTDAAATDVRAEVLLEVEEAFLTSATRGVQPVAAIDGRPLATPGPLTQAARQAYDALVARTSDP